MKSLFLAVLLIATALSGSRAHAVQIRARLQTVSFTSKFSSYPQPQDFFRLLYEKFPLAFPTLDQGSSYTYCLFPSGQDDIQRAMGQNDPSTGEPVFREPSPAFVRWFTGCVNGIVNTDFSGAVLDGLAPLRYLSDKTWKDLLSFEDKQKDHAERATNPGTYTDPKGTIPNFAPKNVAIMGRQVSEIPAPLVSEVMHDLFDRMIGPGVISDSEENDYLDKIRQAAAPGPGEPGDLAAFVLRSVKLMLMTPEFLTTAPR